MIKIFQINMDRDKKKVKFMPYKFVKRVDFSIYDEIWCGEVPKEYDHIEGIFEVFNLYHPNDFHGHSLSVSDIVQVVNSDNIESGYYYCDMLGWKKVDIK